MTHRCNAHSILECSRARVGASFENRQWLVAHNSLSGRFDARQCTEAAGTRLGKSSRAAVIASRDSVKCAPASSAQGARRGPAQAPAARHDRGYRLKGCKGLGRHLYPYSLGVRPSRRRTWSRGAFPRPIPHHSPRKFLRTGVFRNAYVDRELALLTACVCLGALLATWRERSHPRRMHPRRNRVPTRFRFVSRRPPRVRCQEGSSRAVVSVSLRVLQCLALCLQSPSASFAVSLCLLVPLFVSVSLDACLFVSLGLRVSVCMSL